ncbi:glutamate synthase central domain protein [Mycobacterium xenopi 4042]|uniref:Glutamate synthase central domain protein n=1 Tax=Mycobacterium xenopi 4042 TaxID=1299334 RepID=X8CMS7_MYCXE|nr:glutamate synthase central domain protein [Mycobacterium xenopi 4042]
MAFESIEDMLDRGVLENLDRETALRNYIKAAGKGVLKVMSKMGISTLASYTGAQLFQAVGISEEVLDEYFTGLTCPTGGITLDDIAADVAARHSLAFLDRHASAPIASSRWAGIPVAPGGRIPPVQPGHGVQAAAFHPHRAVQDLQGVHQAGR